MILELAQVEHLTRTRLGEKNSFFVGDLTLLNILTILSKI
jgi:hypothetical protein